MGSLTHEVECLTRNFHEEKKNFEQFVNDYPVVKKSYVGVLLKVFCLGILFIIISLFAFEFSYIISSMLIGWILILAYYVWRLFTLDIKHTIYQIYISRYENEYKELWFERVLVNLKRKKSADFYGCIDEVASSHKFSDWKIENYKEENSIGTYIVDFSDEYGKILFTKIIIKIDSYYLLDSRA